MKFNRNINNNNDNNHLCITFNNSLDKTGSCPICPLGHSESSNAYKAFKHSSTVWFDSTDVKLDSASIQIPENLKFIYKIQTLHLDVFNSFATLLTEKDYRIQNSISFISLNKLQNSFMISKLH